MTNDSKQHSIHDTIEYVCDILDSYPGAPCSCPKHKFLLDAKEGLRAIEEQLGTTERDRDRHRKDAEILEKERTELCLERGQLQEQLEAAQERLAQIRPLSDAEWAVLMCEHDVLHEARRLSKSVGVINTMAALDKALRRYDEAVAVREREASTPASEPEAS